MSIKLPAAFEERMKEMLKEEYEEYISSYGEERQYGLRVNTLRIEPEEFEKLFPFSVERVPWTENGFYYRGEDRPSVYPWYAAGVYYLQEPSAMTPASRLPVQPGECVLDLCAAPGGKATELGARLNGKGVLVANDISNSRAKALLHNLELCGVYNVFVTNEIPGNLSKSFPEYFDKIMVDAPCSGEGMFRKDPDVALSWDEERPQYFAKLQRDIVKNAIQMLKPGGMMLYSTCTFAPEENEGTISWILENFPEMKLQDVEWYEGFCTGNPSWGNGDEELRKCVRIWPHKMNGEGHFMALLKKDGTRICEYMKNNGKIRVDRKTREILQEFFRDVNWDFDWEQIDIRLDKVYLVPVLPDRVKGLKFLRNGLFLGELKKNRFEPSQPLAMVLNSRSYSSCINLAAQDPRVERYLKGETIVLEGSELENRKGWQLVCVDGFSLGWGKAVNGLLKNKYLVSWRKKN